MNKIKYLIIIVCGLFVLNINVNALEPNKTVDSLTFTDNYTGVVKYQNNLYYIKNGAVTKGQFVTINSKIYYFNKAEGKLYKYGWLTKNGNKYYFDKTTGEAYIGTHVIDGVTYVFDDNGKLVNTT